MASLYNGLTVAVSGSGRWWTGTWNGSKWSGVRYVGTGSTAVYSYNNGSITVQISYTLENKGTWEDINGSAE